MPAMTARPSQTTLAGTWMFPGRIELEIVANWQQAPSEAILQDLKAAREMQEESDSALIAGLRQLSADCSRMLARCRMHRDAA